MSVVKETVLLVLLTTSPAYADCIDSNSNTTYCGSYSGCGGNSGDFYFAQVATQSGQCYWVYQNPNHVASCPSVYNTQGAKGNLGTQGGPFVYDGDSTHKQHVLQWLTAVENPSSCTTGAQTGSQGCWVQVGWEVGYSHDAGGCSNSAAIDPASPAVEVEIYDDSSAPCFLSTFGSAPSNASYDARFYSVSGSYYQYNVYFEVPGSNNIQWLAYADFNSKNTTEQVSAEAREDATTNSNFCPVVGQTATGNWNQVGQTASQSTFASNMQLYLNGSWVNWTTSYVPTYGYIWPPNGTDYKGQGSSSNPYQIQAVSNWNGGDFTQWETGGPR